MSESFGRRTPWGDEDSPALVTQVETALERELQENIMRGDKKPDIRRVKEGKTLVEQGSSSSEMFLLLNGVLVVEVDGEKVAELGPGAVFGERAVLEGGTRTATLARRDGLQGRSSLRRSNRPCEARRARRRAPSRGSTRLIRLHYGQTA